MDQTWRGRGVAWPVFDPRHSIIQNLRPSAPLPASNLDPMAATAEEGDAPVTTGLMPAGDWP